MNPADLKVLITGAGGQVGRALAAANWPQGIEPLCLSRSDLDITDPKAVEQGLGIHRPDLIINAAAFTDVAKAEMEAEAAYAVNAKGPAYLARYARRNGCGLIHISTDFVFSGPGPHAEKARTYPLNLYGASKLAGEQAVMEEEPDALIVRTSWVFDAIGPNFVTKLLARADQAELSVVEDEIGCPTSADDIATGLILLAQKLLTGPAPEHRVFHLTNQGETSRFDMAQALFDHWSSIGHPVPQLVRARQADFAHSVQRPKDSRLSSRNLQLMLSWSPGPWRDALIRVVDQIGAGEARG